MDRLREILNRKAAEIARLVPRSDHFRAIACERHDFRGFAAALHHPASLGLIAEVKKASPSAGTIAERCNPVLVAKSYESAGAHAVSVLTEEHFFHGSLADLKQVRAAISLPILRKDFILHEVQIFEAIGIGADAILLIVAAVDQPQLIDLHQTARDFQLDVLVEVHTLAELERALDAGAELIGINNRNLATFTVDLQTTETLAQEVPDGIILVSESGIKTNADARRLHAAGADAILVGETLMRAKNVQETVASLLAIH